MTKKFICLNKPPEKGTIYYTFDLSENKKILKYTWKGDDTDLDFLRKSLCYLTEKEAKRARKFIFKYIKTHYTQFKSMRALSTSFPIEEVYILASSTIWRRTVVTSIKYDFNNSIHGFKFRKGLVFRTKKDAIRAIELITETLASYSRKHSSKVLRYFQDLNKVIDFPSKELRTLSSGEAFNFLTEFPESGARVFVADPTNRVGYTSFIHTTETDSLSDRNTLSLRDFLLRSGLLYLTKADAIRASNAMRKRINPDALNLYSLPD